ncbi:MAG: FtsW/RodA/SpoVE family cell cycle protein [Anaeromicrobium sp.]|uniref:FtsW/RodA/SpoVE family cell cycle protein n=1 Tax=Anaeromicrobium sp. TaxID=1929132 RepID=UPI0025E94FC4|nr:FtsW/RodA/SpoVE family cell cycle protein [Anaeromicrobium sp.]MCT4593437.1 FtsW/RodA/SpoVE family cell cycle protein [Anaeromicrobium sp.]
MSVENNSYINEYLSQVCSHVKYKEAHKEIGLELTSHIYDVADEYIEDGLSEEEAFKHAINRMGEPMLVGKELNVAHKGTPDWITLILTLTFVNLGIFIMYLLKSYNGYEWAFYNSIRYGLAGTFCIVLLYYFDYRKLKRYSYHLFAGTLLICLITIFNGEYVLGRPMLRILGNTINFIGISPFLFVIALAGIFSQRNWNEDNDDFISVTFKSKVTFKLSNSLLKFFLLMIIPSFIMFIFPSTACLILYYVGFMIMAVLSGMKKKYTVLPIVVSILGCLHLIIAYPYRMVRLFSYINYYKDPQGAGYTNMQIHNIIQSAKLFGQGFIFPKQTLPLVHTEFLLNYILYAFGWTGVIILIGAVGIYLSRMIYITSKINDLYGQLLMGGLLSMIFIEFAFNILMNLNCMPLIGMSLPFMSYGGMLSIIHAISIGIILSVYRRRSLSCCRYN